tara:strand:+ start:208 stop:978 length:771 start_codon:yes stop_codon:yes gene_type:complete
MKQKFFFLFDKNRKSQNFKKNILKKFSNNSPKNATHFVVAGGDGFMLSILKKYYKYNKPFYGVNCGTFGFLMNNLNVRNFGDKIKKAKKISINPLEFKTKSKGKYVKKIIAINEISLFRQSKQTASLTLKVGNKIIIKRLIGDGILVSSPAGSTAYNLSVNGPILSLDSGKLAITPISPFRPRRWKGKIISNKSKVSIKNLDFKKRPVAAVADNVEFRNIKNISIKANKKIRIILLYDSKRSLIERIRKEQIRREN